MKRQTILLSVIGCLTLAGIWQAVTDNNELRVPSSTLSKSQNNDNAHSALSSHISAPSQDRKPKVFQPTAVGITPTVAPTKMHFMSVDTEEEVFIDISNQTLVLRDNITGEKITLTELSADSIAINLSSDVNIITEIYDKDIAESDNLATQPDLESFNTIDTENGIFFDERAPDQVILRENGFDKIVEISQAEEALDLFDKNSDVAFDY